MPATTKQRTLVWAAVLVYLIYLVASHWHSLRHGMFSFPPLFGLCCSSWSSESPGTSTGRPLHLRSGLKFSSGRQYQPWFYMALCSN